MEGLLGAGGFQGLVGEYTFCHSKQLFFFFTLLSQVVLAVVLPVWVAWAISRLTMRTGRGKQGKKPNPHHKLSTMAWKVPRESQKKGPTLLLHTGEVGVPLPLHGLRVCCFSLQGLKDEPLSVGKQAEKGSRPKGRPTSSVGGLLLTPAKPSIVKAGWPKMQSPSL